MTATNKQQAAKPNKKNIWAVYFGKFYDDGYIVAIFDQKKDADGAIKAEGYKYNKEEKLYINNNDPIFNEACWYRIDKELYNRLY